MERLAGEVHLWIAHLDLEEANTAAYFSMLSQAEKVRAQRFRTQQHQQRFIASHGILRVLLSQYLEINPAQVCFAYLANGKPILDMSSKFHTLSFNMSHSEEWALYGVTCDCEVGVDLEQIRSLPDLNEIAHHFFTAQEIVFLKSQPPSQQAKTFFRYWTCKEAYLKGTGDGLSHLQDIAVELSEPSARFYSPKGKQLAEEWMLQELEPTPGYWGAIAWKGSASKALKLFRWNVDRFI